MIENLMFTVSEALGGWSGYSADIEMKSLSRFIILHLVAKFGNILVNRD